MASESYELSWKEFEQCASQSFKDHYNLDEYADVTLACDDDKQIKSHKMILSACSPFFQKILRNNPHQHPLIYLKGIKHNSLRSLLRFMYLGETKVSEEDLKPFLEAADELKVKGLSDADKSKNLSGNVKKEHPQPNSKASTDQSIISEYSQFNYGEMEKDVINEIATADFVYVDSNYADNIPADTNYDDASNSPYNGPSFLTEFQTITDMDIKSVLDNRKYPCDQCVYKAGSKELLMAHITSIHVEDLPSNVRALLSTSTPKASRTDSISKQPRSSKTKPKKKNFTVRCNLCEMLLLNEENSLMEHVKWMHGA